MPLSATSRPKQNVDSADLEAGRANTARTGSVWPNGRVRREVGKRPQYLYNETVTKTYKTFLVTYLPVGGVIRVVLIKEDHGWLAFFCT